MLRITFALQRGKQVYSALLTSTPHLVDLLNSILCKRLLSIVVFNAIWIFEIENHSCSMDLYKTQRLIFKLNN